MIKKILNYILNLNKKIIFSFLTFIVLIIIFFSFNGIDEESNETITVEVKKGVFEVNVVTTGELQARNSENIIGPSGIRAVGIWNVNIIDLVPEGTVVKAGDYIAALDRSELTNKISEVQSELEKLEAQYVQSKLDTALELRSSRDEIINLKFSLEENQIALEQSTFEPPATLRQAKINLEKAERNYKEAIQNYEIKRELAVAKTRQVFAMLIQHREKRTFLEDLYGKFEIHAPKDGMLIYAREWDGTKKKVGSSISPWQPEVATLPDLSEMISHTYVNEVDISKVKTGQLVRVGIDAFPQAKYKGKVISVANVGEQLNNSDAKVFELKIEVVKPDSLLRPAMTTSNSIVTNVLEDVLSLPIECIYNNDSLTYVYRKNLFINVKQEVLVGLANEDMVVITKGLEAGDKVYLSVPENAEKLDINLLSE